MTGAHSLQLPLKYTFREIMQVVFKKSVHLFMTPTVSKNVRILLCA